MHNRAFPFGYVSAVVFYYNLHIVALAVRDALGLEVYPRATAGVVNGYPLSVDVYVVRCDTRKVIPQAERYAVAATTIGAIIKLRTYGRRRGVSHETVGAKITCASRQAVVAVTSTGIRQMTIGTNGSHHGIWLQLLLYGVRKDQSDRFLQRRIVVVYAVCGRENFYG